MKSKILPFLFLLSLALVFTGNGQDADKQTDEALRQAADAAKKMGMQMPDVKKIMEEEAKEEAKKKARVQAALSAPGPAAFPDWTPKVPEFTPDGPAAKTVVDNVAQLLQTGTSPLTPVALAAAWEKFKNDKWQLGRLDSNVNGTITQKVTFRETDDPNQEVTMRAVRGPREKITHVTISSPLPTPAAAKTDE